MPRLVLVLVFVFAGIHAPRAILDRAARQQPAVVRAVLFFSPTCPHCHQVINEDLPVIFQRFGGTPRVWVDQSVPRDQITFYHVTNGRLEILLVDASKPAGGQYYEQTTSQFEIPDERSGVPRLIIGDSVLVGSLEIPQVFPVLIQQATANGGMDWPAIEGLREHIPAIPAAPPVVAQTADSVAPTADSVAARPDSASAADASPPTADTAAPPARTATPPPREATVDSARMPAPADPAPPELGAADSTNVTAQPEGSATPQGTLGEIPTSQASMLANFRQDPVGNSAAVVVLLAMVISVLIIGRRAAEWTGTREFGLVVPFLAAVGIVVAGYLTYVETSGTLAVCGPVGDCNAVQQSSYARLFGVLPVGLLGLIGYVVVIAGWLATRLGEERIADWGMLAVFGVAFTGTIFSIYLTFLEPFVIGATCAWCLTSSIVITALLWLSAGPGTAAWVRITNASRPPASETP